MTTLAPAERTAGRWRPIAQPNWQPVGSIFFADNRSGNQTGNQTGNLRGSCSQHGRPRQVSAGTAHAGRAKPPLPRHTRCTRPTTRTRPPRRRGTPSWRGSNARLTLTVSSPLRSVAGGRRPPGRRTSVAWPCDRLGLAGLGQVDVSPPEWPGSPPPRRRQRPPRGSLARSGCSPRPMPDAGARWGPCRRARSS